MPHASVRRDGVVYDTRKATQLTRTLSRLPIETPVSYGMTSEELGWAAGCIYRDYRGQFFFRQYIIDQRGLTVFDALTHLSPQDAEAGFNSGGTQLVGYRRAFEWGPLKRRAADRWDEVRPYLTWSHYTSIQKVLAGSGGALGVAWRQGWLHSLIVLIQRLR